MVDFRKALNSPTIYCIHNGDDISEYSNIFDLGEALADLVLSNESTHFVTHELMLRKTKYINIVVQ